MLTIQFILDIIIGDWGLGIGDCGFGIVDWGLMSIVISQSRTTDKQ